MPREPCRARIEASEARTFGLRSSAKVTAFFERIMGDRKREPKDKTSPGKMVDLSPE
jgi:hypothetical protein